jgi:hypothetical protein
MRGISWQAEDVFVFQEGLCFMELVYCLWETYLRHHFLLPNPHLLMAIRDRALISFTVV